MGIVALAVDLGGPIIRQEMMQTEWSFEALAFLRTRFGDRIHVISQCDVETERLRTEWLERRKFTEKTGITRDRILFCRDVWEKAEICELIGATHYVENSIRTMKYVRTAPHLFLYHPSRTECDDPANAKFMANVFDPSRQRPEEAARRPITLIREWSPSTVRLITEGRVFRTMPYYGIAPGMPSSWPPHAGS